MRRRRPTSSPSGSSVGRRRRTRRSPTSRRTPGTGRCAATAAGSSRGARTAPTSGRVGLFHPRGLAGRRGRVEARARRAGPRVRDRGGGRRDRLGVDRAGPARADLADRGRERGLAARRAAARRGQHRRDRDAVRQRRPLAAHAAGRATRRGRSAPRRSTTPRASRALLREAMARFRDFSPPGWEPPEAPDGDAVAMLADPALALRARRARRRPRRPGRVAPVGRRAPRARGPGHRLPRPDLRRARLVGHAAGAQVDVLRHRRRARRRLQAHAPWSRPPSRAAPAASTSARASGPRGPAAEDERFGMPTIEYAR